MMVLLSIVIAIGVIPLIVAFVVFPLYHGLRVGLGGAMMMFEDAAGPKVEKLDHKVLSVEHSKQVRALVRSWECRNEEVYTAAQEIRAANSRRVR
jgi:hypothetical protein